MEALHDAFFRRMVRWAGTGEEIDIYSFECIARRGSGHSMSSASWCSAQTLMG